MKSIFQKYKAIGFDFDHILVHIDELHKKSWEKVVDVFELHIEIKDFFVHKISSFHRFDNYTNVINCIVNNKNVLKTPQELIEQTNFIKKKFPLKGSFTVKNINDLAKFFYLMKNHFLLEIIQGLSEQEMFTYTDKYAWVFVEELKKLQPNLIIYIASSTSSDAIRALLQKINKDYLFDLIIGEADFQANVENFSLDYDKPTISSSSLLKKKLIHLESTIKSEEILYIGDDSIRDFQFIKNINGDYIQIKYKPKFNINSLFFNSFEEILKYVNKPLLKICRIEDVHVARYLSRLQVTFLGLHIIHKLPQGIQILNKLKKINKELNAYYPSTKTVLVTRIEDPIKIAQIHSLLQTDMIQLHSNMPMAKKSELKLLLESVGKEFNFFHVISSEREKEDKGIVNEFILLDKNFTGGTGEEIKHENVKQLIKKNKSNIVFLAGGINIENVKEKIQKLDISGLDIQSSLELSTSSHKKDIYKVNSIIETIYDEVEILDLPQKEILSISLQEQELHSKILNLEDVDIDSIHADYSDGSIIGNWKINCDNAVKYWAEMHPFIPLDIHIFSIDILYIKTVVSHLLKIHPQIRMIFFHIRDIKDFNLIRKNITALNIRNFGISINYRNNITTDELVTIMLFIKEIIICLPTLEREKGQADVIAYNLVTKIYKIKIQHKLQHLRIGVDREVTPSRISLFSKLGIEHFVIGKYLYNASNLIKSVNYLRSIYE